MEFLDASSSERSHDSSVNPAQLAPVPDLMPVRMLNEYVWCPRFTYLSWAEGFTGENENTVEGTQLHRRVDVAAEFDLPNGRTVRTAWTLGSQTLGLIGRADRVEFEGGEAILVEFKRGKPKEGEMPLWDPELVQVTAFLLLLAEAGHRVRGAEVFFGETRRRVPVPIDPASVARVPEIVAEARRVLADPLPPPPLVDSPKCGYCVLAPICLPDEITRIREPDRPTKRVIPQISNSHPLYVTEAGSKVGREDKRLTLTVRGEKVTDVRLIDVSSVVLTGNSSMSAQATRACLTEGVPVLHVSAGGWLNGYTAPTHGGFVELRRRQYLAMDAGFLGVARRMISGKIQNGRTLLRRNGQSVAPEALAEMKRLAVRAEQAADSQSLLGIEGGAARIYFSQFNSMLKYDGDEFDFTKRTRRPPEDRINALLSYCYGLLVKDCVVALHAVGFDPAVGVFHRPRFGRPAMALDLAEEFRPIIAESVVITLINNQEVSAADFVSASPSVALRADARRSVIKAFERRMTAECLHPVFGYRVSYRRALEVQARLIAAVFLEEAPEYIPFTTR
jgi:CRISP-associated protein Cas1